MDFSSAILSLSSFLRQVPCQTNYYHMFKATPAHVRYYLLYYVIECYIVQYYIVYDNKIVPLFKNSVAHNRR